MKNAIVPILAVLFIFFVLGAAPPESAVVLFGAIAFFGVIYVLSIVLGKALGQKDNDPRNPS